MSSSTGPLARSAAYSDLFERMGEAVLLVDMAKKTVAECNPAAERILGYSDDELKGKLLTSLVHSSQATYFEQALRIARRRYYPRTVEGKFITKSGKYITAEVSLCLLNLSNGRQIYQVVVKDITREREAEEKATKYLEELKNVNNKLEVLSITDELTQLFNFRKFSEELKAEHLRAERYGTPYSVIFCDIDHFKKYNDQNGHGAGDEALKIFSGLLVESMRKTDRAARYGGEEFAVICAGVNWEGATVLAERLRQNVEAYSFPHGSKQPTGRVTISIGVASFPFDGKTPQEVLEAADQALYFSKENGRNRVSSGYEARSVQKFKKREVKKIA